MKPSGRRWRMAIYVALLIVLFLVSAAAFRIWDSTQTYPRKEPSPASAFEGGA